MSFMKHLLDLNGAEITLRHDRVPIPDGPEWFCSVDGFEELYGLGWGKTPWEALEDLAGRIEMEHDKFEVPAPEPNYDTNWVVHAPDGKIYVRVTYDEAIRKADEVGGTVWVSHSTRPSSRQIYVSRGAKKRSEGSKAGQ
jgi:hypothetical protein